MDKKKVCWKITSNCNQNCKYCFKVLNLDDLTYEENKKILMKLINDGITDITWNGGEPLLYTNIFDLLRIAKENGIKNKLITNGKLLFNSENFNKIKKYVDNLTVSLDTINEKINLELGGDINYLENIKNILNYTKSKKIELNINTVVNRKNLNELDSLGEFLNNYKINSWKFIEFAPFRGIARKNRNEFEISDFEFKNVKKFSNCFKNIKTIEYRTSKDLERNNLVIIPNGEIVRTVNGQDIKLGNALYDNVVKFLDDKERKMYKIRTLIAYDDKEFKQKIVNLIKDIDGVEIVGTAEDGEETYEKIVNLKPEMVFTKFDLDKMDGLEIIKKSKENMEEAPVFNVISNRALGDDLDEMIRVAGLNFNALIHVKENVETKVKSIFKDYREYKNLS